MPRRLLSAAAAGALLLGLAACGDPNDGPVTTPPPDIGIEAPSDGGGDTDPSDGGGEETESPTAAAPDIPPPDPADYAGMDKNTEDGAEQAFRYYIAVSMWAHQTGDASMLDDLEQGSCDSCEEFLSTFTELREHDQLWGKFTLKDVSTGVHESTNFDYEIVYDFKTTPHDRPKDDFSGRITVENLEYSTVGGMTWFDSGWRVGAISAEWGDGILGT